MMLKMWQDEGEAPSDDTSSDTKGDYIQKLSVIETLPTLLAGDAQSCISRLMPKMQQTLPTASPEFHMAASTTFKTILEQRLVSHSTFTQTFLQSILNSLDSRDPVVAHAWLETLLDVIELLPPEVIRQEILPMAINKGQLSQPISSRITCSKLVGKICTRFDSQLIKMEVLPTVHSLCQDVNSEVRACICLQLRYVAEGLGAESVKPALLPSIVELASDEESIVRHASVQTIVHLLPQLQTDVIKSTIAPLIKKLCDNALKSDDTVLCVIAQEFGKLALGLEKCLTAAEKTWLVNYFQQLSQLGVPTMKKISDNPLVNERYVECRWQCAFNIPAMYRFNFSADEDIDVLLPIFSDLAGDPYYMVRRTIACGIHEVAKILGPRNNTIRGALIKLLKDDSEEVLQGLVPHLAETCELLLQSETIGTERINSAVVDLGRALLKCEAEIATTNNWRLFASMFEQMEVLPKCFPSDFIYTYFVPVALNLALNARPMPVRLAAGRTLLVFLRYNNKPTQKMELRNRLYTEFARNSSSYVRMLYIRMMIEAMDIFSSMYFKEYFYATVLSLTEDPIANVRLKVVTLLPALKSYIRLPSDKKLLSSLESSVRNLMNNEKDRDVIFALTNVIHKLDAIDVRHEGQSTSLKLTKYESDDLKKYEEEKRLLNVVPGKTTASSASTVQSTSISTKKHPIGTKLGGIARMSTDMSADRSGRQNSMSGDPQRSSMSTVLPKGKQAMPPNSMSEVPPRTSRPVSRISDMSKASSMPMIPVPLQDDEFLVDAGIRIPDQLSSCQSTSRIPKLQDIIHRNRRVVGNSEQRSCSGERSRSSSVNLDKGKTRPTRIFAQDDCFKQRSTSVDQVKTNRSSVNYDEVQQQHRSKSNIEDHHHHHHHHHQTLGKDDPRTTKRYSTPRGKIRPGFELQQSKSIEDKGKRCSMILDKDKSKISQPKNVIDRTKRHSASYSSHIPDPKDSKQKFKRHSLEVTDCNTTDSRTSRLKRNFTLDVNHNQGSSKISSMRSSFALGSRTAPVTRASSPILAERFLRDHSLERHLTKFSSSDEEVDKLCIRFAYNEPPNIRDDRSCTRVSRLPVWMRRKKP